MENKEQDRIEIFPEDMEKIAGGMSDGDQAKLMDLLAKTRSWMPKRSTART